MSAVSILATGGPDWGTAMTGVATAALAALAVLTLVGTVYQIHRNRMSEREARAHHYLARYNEASQIKYFARMQTFVALKGVSEATRIKEWEEMSSDDRMRTVHALNFWEELAGMYNRNLVDCVLVRNYWGTPAVDVWDRAEWFIEYQRKANPRVMVELQKMCADISRKRGQPPWPPTGHIPPDQAVLPELIRRWRVRREAERQLAAGIIT